MSWKFVETQVENRLGTIHLNRPDKRNALNAKFVKELREAFESFRTNEDVKTVRILGNGPAFCAGADLGYLQELQVNTYEENLEDSQNLKALFETIYRFPKLVIAQVEGPAIAGGSGLATVCDFVFSVPEASFGYTEVRIGFVPAIVSVFLMRKIGEAKSRELLLTGRIIKAEEALRMGLIQYIYTPEDINDAVLEFADKMNSKVSGDSLALTKSLIADLPSMDIKDAFDYAAKTNAKARETKDCKAGIAAFLNKEKINW